MRGGGAARRWAVLIVGLPLVALSLVVLAEAIPDRHVTNRLRDAILQGQLQERSYDVGMTGAQLDGFSECKRLTVGLGVEPGTSVFESAIRSPTLGPCESAVPKILASFDGQRLVSSYEYFRYWNGSTTVLRPAVVSVGLGGTRLLAALALGLAVVALLWQAGRRVGTLSSALLVAPLLLTTDFIDLPGALVHAIGMIVALAATVALLWLVPPDASSATFAAVAFASGGASQFFGDLTNPDRHVDSRLVNPPAR
jgi:hypothetical protein